MNFRSYKKEDKDRLVEIFHSNCPKYFNENDINDFIDFLNNYADKNYLVVIENNNIIGCGGHYTKADYHGIAWVMFENGSIGFKHIFKVADSFYQKIDQNIKAEKRRLPILINTTQLLEKLFNRYQFKTYQIIKDGFGIGLDEYKMKKVI